MEDKAKKLEEMRKKFGLKFPAKVKESNNEDDSDKSSDDFAEDKKELENKRKG